MHLRVIRLEFEKRLAKLQVKLSSGIVLLPITLSHSFKDLNDMFASRRDELLPFPGMSFLHWSKDIESSLTEAIVRTGSQRC